MQNTKWLLEETVNKETQTDAIKVDWLNLPARCDRPYTQSPGMMQLQSQFLYFHCPTQPYVGLWNILVTSLSDHMLVHMHILGSALQDPFCYIPVYGGVF
jgi:hypothetical protein